MICVNWHVQKLVKFMLKIDELYDQEDSSIENFLTNLEDLGEEFQEILEENLFDMYEYN